MQRNVIRIALRPRRPRTGGAIITTAFPSSSSSIIGRQISTSPVSLRTRSSSKLGLQSYGLGNEEDVKYYNAFLQDAAGLDKLAEQLEPLDQEHLRVSRQHLAKLSTDLKTAERVFKTDIIGDTIKRPPWSSSHVPVYTLEPNRGLPGARNTIAKSHEMIERLDWHLKDLLMEEYCRPNQGWRKEAWDKRLAGLKADFDKKVESGKDAKQIFREMKDAEKGKARQLQQLRKRFGELIEQARGGEPSRQSNRGVRRLDLETIRDGDDGKIAGDDGDRKSLVDDDDDDDDDDGGNPAVEERKTRRQRGLSKQAKGSKLARRRRSRERRSAGRAAKRAAKQEEEAQPQESVRGEDSDVQKPSAKPGSLEDRIKQSEQHVGIKKV